MERILVIVAHSDDETLGCGGTIKRHVDCGDHVFAVSMTDGVSSRGNIVNDDRQHRVAAAERAAEALGFTWLDRGAFPDNQMDSVPLLEVAQFVEACAGRIKPTLVYTHHAGDLNVDHRVVSQAVLTSFRPQPGTSTREVRTFEVASSTEWAFGQIAPHFRPNLYVDISASWEAKLNALKAYDREMRPHPHSRSYDALYARAQYRGCEMGLPLAEAFETLWRIV